MTDAFMVAVLVWALVAYFAGLAAMIWGMRRDTGKKPWAYEAQRVGGSLNDFWLNIPAADSARFASGDSVMMRFGRLTTEYVVDRVDGKITLKRRDANGG